MADPAARGAERLSDARTSEEEERRPRSDARRRSLATMVGAGRSCVSIPTIWRGRRAIGASVTRAYDVPGMGWRRALPLRRDARAALQFFAELCEWYHRSDNLREAKSSKRIALSRDYSADPNTAYLWVSVRPFGRHSAGGGGRTLPAKRAPPLSRATATRDRNRRAAVDGVSSPTLPAGCRCCCC